MKQLSLFSETQVQELPPHLMTEKQWNKLHPNINDGLHAHVIRGLLEKKVQKYAYHPEKRPAKSQLLRKYRELYYEALPENKTFVTIGFLNALHTKAENYSNGNYIYNLSDDEINLNCNKTHQQITKTVSENIYT